MIIIRYLMAFLFVALLVAAGVLQGAAHWVDEALERKLGRPWP